jgi:hypothetical protein
MGNFNQILLLDAGRVLMETIQKLKTKTTATCAVPDLCEERS